MFGSVSILLKLVYSNYYKDVHANFFNVYIETYKKHDNFLDRKVYVACSAICYSMSEHLR